MVNLKLLYRRLNKKYFNSKLLDDSKIVFIWMRARTWVGEYSYLSKTIRLSKPYHDFFPSEIEDTMLHEMIHLKYQNHGKKFYQEMERIRKLGGNVHVTALYSLREVDCKHLYECVLCGHETRTFREIKYWKIRCQCGGSIKRLW